MQSAAITTVGDSVADTTVPDSTTPLDLDTSVAPDTTITTEPPADTTTPTTKKPKPTVPAARSKPPLSTDGAFLVPPGSPESRQLDQANQCPSLARTNSAELCDIVAIGGNVFAWVFEAGGEGVDLLSQDADLPDIWHVELRANGLPTQTPRFADVTGDGQPEIVLGWRDDNDTLNVDIVEARGRSLVVTLHLPLLNGRLSAGGGSLDAWNGVPQEGDAEGNPSSFDRWSYAKKNGQWVASAERDDNPPAGQL